MSVRILMLTATLALFGLSSATQAQPASAPAGTGTAAAGAADARAKVPAADVSEGQVAYYGRKFDGRKTASGERFNSQALTMAHKTLPFGTLVRVTNLKNSRSVVVRVNDRGPSNPDRVGDVSLAAARHLRMLRSGVADARLESTGTAKGRKAPASTGVAS